MVASEITKENVDSTNSALPACSIIDLATDSWLKPPIVRLVVSVEKLASPETKIKIRTNKSRT